jgi:hypothetical protein
MFTRREEPGLIAFDHFFEFGIPARRAVPNPEVAVCFVVYDLSSFKTTAIAEMYA